VFHKCKEEALKRAEMQLRRQAANLGFWQKKDDYGETPMQNRCKANFKVVENVFDPKS
jgi:hypothetical protein